MISKFLISIFAMISMANAHEVTAKMTLSPAGSFDASTTKVRGEIKKEGDKYTCASLWLKVDELKTGIDLRDEHFHKHLNSEKFPKISVQNIVASKGVGTGEMVVTDVTKKIDFTYKQINDKKIEVNFKVKPSDFKLKEAKYLEIGVDDLVEVVAILDV